MAKIVMLIVFISLCCGSVFASGVDESTRKAFNAAKEHRVAVVALGDSNQKFGGHGWTKFMADNLMKAFGAYAAAIIPYGDSIHQKVESAPLPDKYAKELFSGWFIADGKTIKSNWFLGSLFIPEDHPMDVSGPLTFHIQSGTFAFGEGSFQPAMRLNKAPWKLLAKMEKPHSTKGEADKLEWVDFSVPADPERKIPLMFSTSPVNAPITGPFAGSMLSCENTEKTAGISYHTMYAQGGQSLFDMLKWAKGKGPEKLANFMGAVKKLVNDNGSVIVMIHSGMNDRNEKSTSIGPGKGQKGDSAEAYYDNLKGLTIELAKAWELCGGNKDKLFFCFMPSHPVGNPDDEKLISYRAQAQKLAGEMGDRAGVILLPEIVSFEKMSKDGYFDKGRKTGAHLSTLGYDSISSAVVRKMQQ